MVRRRRTGDAEIASWIEEEMHTVVQELKVAIENNIHVDTGALRDSVTVEESGEDFYVGIDEDLLVTDPRNTRGRNYAGYHHDGTYKTPANPFLDKANNEVGSG